jgi:hypothetical protein
MALAMEGAIGQELPDRLDQGLVRHRADRSGPPSTTWAFQRAVRDAMSPQVAMAEEVWHGGARRFGD